MLAVTVSTQDHIVYLVGEDAVTLDDVLEARRQLVHEIKLPVGYSTLVDFRAATLDEIDAGDIQRLAGTRHELPYVTVGSRLAVVATSPSAFGLARMYELSRPAAVEEMRVFSNYVDAHRWVASMPR